jgi:hypothetical protein
MRALRRFLITITAFLALVPAYSLEAKSKVFKANNVVVLVIDGPRQSEMWGDPARRHIPHLSKELAPKGTLMPGFRNNGPTYTAAGHTALCTGFYEEIDNSGNQLPSHASMFQHFLKATGLPKEKVWVITSKDKLAVLGDTAELGWHWLYTPSVWSGAGGKGPGAGYAEDSETMATVKAVLGRHHPRLVLINLKQPDANGHGGKWERYLQALHESDAYAGELWKFLQADPHYRNHTAYFVTHDHGRHLDGVADGFVNHGDDCEGCRRVALLVLGPDFKKGAIIKAGGEQIDLPVTIAAILGFKMPDCKGRVLTELFASF